MKSKFMHGLLLIVALTTSTMLYAQSRVFPTEEVQTQLPVSASSSEALKPPVPKEFQSKFFNRHGRVDTHVSGVPIELRQKRITNLGQAIEVVDVLRSAMNMVSSESFEFHDWSGGTGNNTDYFEFGQLIDGIPVEGATIRISVDPESKKILRLSGSGVIANSEFEKRPLVNRGKAIQLAEKYAEQFGVVGVKRPGSRLIYKMDGNGIYQLNWLVRIDTADDLSAPILLWILPDGTVQNAANVVQDIVVCDGSGQPQGTRRCTDSLWGSPKAPLVIDKNGVCQAGYNCDLDKYRVPYDAARRNTDMWEAVLGRSVNAGDIANQNANGAVTIMAEGTTLNPTSTAEYTYVRNCWLGCVREAAIAVKAANTDNHRTMNHELGHAIFNNENDAMFNVAAQGNNEGKAVVEAVAQINEILMENWDDDTGQFKANPTWTTRIDRNAANQKNYPGDMVANNPHKSAEIIMHAFYDIASNPNVGMFNAAKVLLESLAEVDDGNSDNQISYPELRQAMIDAAGSNQTLKNAVMDGWNDVGVGAASSGGTGSGSTAGSGTPPAPTPPDVTNVNVVFTGCASGTISTYWVSWNATSGADFYTLILANAFGIQQHGVTTSNFTNVWTTVKAHLHIRACEGSITGNFVCGDAAVVGISPNVAC